MKIILCLPLNEYIFSFSSFEIDAQSPNRDVIRFEQDVFTPLAGTGKLFVYHTKRFWSQIKSARLE